MTYDVTLVQLTPDAKKAGADYPTTGRAGVHEKELRTLLFAAEILAPTVTYPLAPEIRVAAATGKYVIRLKDGRLRFVSWSTAKSSVVEPSVEEMLAIIRGEVLEHGAGSGAGTSYSAAGRGSSGAKPVMLIGMLAALVVGLNAFTILHDRKPPGNFLPSFRLIEPEPAGRVLASVVGNYETGRAPGDRRLQIGKDGAVRWIKFGANQTVAEEKTFTVQAADTNGVKALLTSRQSMITIKDSSTLVLFGDTYSRVLN